MTDNTEFFMRQAIELARKGMMDGDGGPFGAVIVKDNTIIGRGWNRVLRTNDPTAHAEIVAIRDASANMGNYWLEGCHLYVNCEPCPMCLAAIYWARIESLTFGATRKDAAAIGFDDDAIYGQVCLPAEERSISCRQACRHQAVEIMQIWPTLEEKRPY